jgi:hypothetical protein
LIEQLGVGVRFFLDRDKRGMHGAHLRERQPFGEAEPLGGFIERDDQLDIAAFAVDDAAFTSPRLRGEVDRLSEAKSVG